MAAWHDTPASVDEIRTSFQVPSVSAQEAYAALACPSCTAVLIDVRETREISMSAQTHRVTKMCETHLHTKHRLTHTVRIIAAELEMIAPSLNTPLYFLCRSAKRSKGAARFAALLGYTVVYDIDGGFQGDRVDGRRHTNGWLNEGLPSVVP